LGGSIIFSGTVLPDVVVAGASFDCVDAVGFCCVTEEIGSDNVCMVSHGIGAATGAAFSSGDIFVVGAGACIACAIASDDSRVCREVFWTRALPVRKYQHWRPLFA
jgi:hypothetical protein